MVTQDSQPEITTGIVAPNWSYPRNLTNVNGILYFTADNSINGHELWKIDSTGNAVIVTDINPGATSSGVWDLTNVNGTLYFTASDNTTGRELWKIDSTGNAVIVTDINPAAIVTDINPAAISSFLSSLTNVDGTLYFVAGHYNYNAFIDRQQLYFTASNSTNGQELWKIDSNGNAVLLKDLNPGMPSYPSDLTTVNGTLYFVASNSTTGKELWKIDSIGNAVLVKDLNPGIAWSWPSNLTNVDGTLYFRANNFATGQELWKIDSTGDAVLVKDINPGTESSSPWDLRNVDGTLYFTAYNITTGRELWKIDDTGNAVLVKDINPEGGLPVDPPVLMSSNALFSNNMLETSSAIKGIGIQAISQKNTNKVNEIGFFNVDDLDGKIDGIAPGEAGYIKAAIERSKSILTTLGGDFFNTQKQEIGLDLNKIYQLFEIENGSLADVKQQLDRGEVPTNIRLSIFDANGYSPIKVTGNSIESGYDISINNDELVLKVTKLDDIMPNRPIGSESQGKIEGRTIDLTNYKNQSLTVDITTKSDAVYQSQIGFYTVKDALGTIELADGTTVNPGDANYAMVAIKNAISNAGLQANRLDSKTNQPIAGGQIYAPVVVAQGTLNDFVNNPSNNMHAYFNYVQGNADKVDHFRQIGANTFGVEDMYGGGDRDFNDLVIQMNIKTV